MSKKTLIAPSVLASDFSRLGDEVARRRGGRRRLDPSRRHGRAFRAQHHLRPAGDQGDPRRTQEALRLHLMIAPADPYLAAFAEAGCDGMTVHAEAGPHLDRSLQTIRALGKKAGVSLNPATPASDDRICARPARPDPGHDRESGFGGQAFIPAHASKGRGSRRMIGDRPIRHRGRRRHIAGDRRPGRRRRRRRAGGGRRHLQGRQRRGLPAKHPGDQDGSRQRSRLNAGARPVSSPVCVR